MAKTNIPEQRPSTHEGAPARRVNPYQSLRRSVMACMLWENEFYEDGTSIAERIASLVELCDNDKVFELAIEARTKFKLRHAPLWLAVALAHKRAKVATLLPQIINRADELAEFVAMYWKDGKQPLSAQVKKGLAAAFQKFNAYQLAKYDRPGAVKLRDVLFLCHAKPIDDDQATTWKHLVEGTLAPPDTWEVGLSTGGDKRETFTTLLQEGKLGYMALLRNLRNMQVAGVDESLVHLRLLEGAKTAKALPFRYVAAARAVPAWERTIDEAMISSMDRMNKLPGKTVFLVDVSYSMHAPLSSKSQLNRIDAACALAVLGNGICESARVFSFSSQLVEVPPRGGMALLDAIKSSQHNGSTYLGGAVRAIDEKVSYDRLIVITDEQSHDPVPNPLGRGYMINVASNKNGVGYGPWVHFDGFSEAVLEYIRESEQ